MNNAHPSQGTTEKSPINSHNEWDLLEEVIVGVIDNAHIPSWNIINEVTVRPGEWQDIVKQISEKEGVPYPKEVIEIGKKDIKEFVAILESEGVIVRRPDILDYSLAYSTPYWNISNSFCAANPRDLFLVIGDEIIEAPMADRGRYFESWAYRPLLKEYFKSGAKWTSAPKPQLLDLQYDSNYVYPSQDEEMRYIITEFEPTFDAADFIRCGKDIFAQKSHVTNDSGILWLQRHLGERYKVHTIETRYKQAIHIDTTFMPLAPGKLLVNPEFLDINKIPSVFNSWDILISPIPADTSNKPRTVSKWIGINVLMLDEERIIVEKKQDELIKSLKDWGFKPIPCSFENFYPFNGSFHCATLDIRRKGILQSYF